MSVDVGWARKVCVVSVSEAVAKIISLYTFTLTPHVVSDLRVIKSYASPSMELYS